jgi:hypothetical protein
VDRQGASGAIAQRGEQPPRGGGQRLRAKRGERGDDLGAEVGGGGHGQVEGRKGGKANYTYLYTVMAEIVYKSGWAVGVGPKGTLRRVYPAEEGGGFRFHLYKGWVGCSCWTATSAVRTFSVPEAYAPGRSFFSRGDSGLRAEAG